MGEFPSGQRGQTVNLLAMPSVVRIHSLPYDAGWSSLEARRAHNPKVVGSNPTPAIIRKQFALALSGQGKIYNKYYLKNDIMFDVSVKPTENHLCH